MGDAVVTVIAYMGIGSGLFLSGAIGMILLGDMILRKH